MMAGYIRGVWGTYHTDAEYVKGGREIFHYVPSLAASLALFRTS